MCGVQHEAYIRCNETFGLETRQKHSLRFEGFAVRTVLFTVAASLTCSEKILFCTDLKFQRCVFFSDIFWGVCEGFVPTKATDVGEGGIYFTLRLGKRASAVVLPQQNFTLDLQHCTRMKRRTLTVGEVGLGNIG